MRRFRLAMNGYFDHNATSPMTALAREEWLRVETSHWHNPSSLYREAGVAKRLLEDLREEVADRLGSDEPERVVFTSGATEANNAVMHYAGRQGSNCVAISAVEHPSVREAAQANFSEVIEWLISDGWGGFVDGREDFSLLSVMAANNETGAIQPWQAIAEKCREMDKWFHCDAAQWIGKADASLLGCCDFVTGCAHKFGGPKGVGFLLLPEKSVIAGREAGAFASLLGGPQENRHRSGTENLAGIAAMVAAWREREAQLAEPGFLASKAEGLDEFEIGLDCEVVGDLGDRMWNTVMLIMPTHSNLKWLTRLSRRGFSLSTGSACSAGKGNPSHVMEAMGLDHDQMGRVLRISGGWETTVEDWRALASAMAEVGAELDSGKRPKAF